jgi:hypothetical protein
MATAPPTSKPKPPPGSPGSPKGPPPGNKAAAAAPAKDFQVQAGKTLKFHKTGFFGAGGSGKTTLASLIAQQGAKPLFLDLDNETGHLDVNRVDIGSWSDLRCACMDKKLLEPFGAIIVDSFTKAEELAVEWTLSEVKHEKGYFVDSVEGYGYGKGYTHVYETFLRLLGDLDAVVRMGKHVIFTAHDCTTTVPNPMGEDWIRWEPRLQHPASGKASIRLRVKEWCTHLLFIGYDQIVDEDGKAKGSGTRTIYPRELPSHLAKSRTLSEPIPYEQGSAELWKQLLNKEG